MEESEKDKIEILVVHLKNYLKENFNLLILNTYEKISKVTSGITSVILFGTILFFTLILFSIGLCIWIGKEFGEPFLGFFLVSGIYLVAGILLYVNRKRWIGLPMINMILKNLTDETD
jgi:hypothetical protein